MSGKLGHRIPQKIRVRVLFREEHRVCRRTLIEHVELERLELRVERRPQSEDVLLECARSDRFWGTRRCCTACLQCCQSGAEVVAVVGENLLFGDAEEIVAFLCHALVPSSILAHPIPSKLLLLARRIVSPVCFTSPNGTPLNSISTMTYLPSSRRHQTVESSSSRLTTSPSSLSPPSSSYRPLPVERPPLVTE
jgi:hypothetical protein